MDVEGARWEIAVYDAALLRPRVLVVAVPEARVVVLPPPGEGLIVPTLSIRPLHDALARANEVALGRNNGQAWP